jgi:sugar lactone lactonase YvrE
MKSNFRHYNAKKSLNRLCILLLAALILQLAGCTTLKQPSIGVLLPEKYNTPDGMVLDADNNILLCCPNFNDDTHPAKLIKITPDDEIVELFTFPPHPETGKACPLGIDVGPDGNYYVADNQGMIGARNKARLLRILVENGRCTGYEVLATGFNQSNAVCCRNDYVYVTETSLDPDTTPMPSGVYRFKYSDFKPRTINLLAGIKDKHLIASFLTDNPDWRVGANGMAFDSKGNMYVCNFGEATIIKYNFDKKQNIILQRVFAKGQGMESTDGIKVDPKNDDIYVADFVANAVHKISKNGKVTTIAKNANNSGGVGGLLDRPSEVCLRGKKVYVSNIDLPGSGNEYDKPHTISVIELKP